MTPRWMRIAYVVFGLVAIATGIRELVRGGESVWGGIQVAIGVGWVAMAFFRDRFAPRLDASLERQRARVEGFGAMSFLPDSDPDSRNK